MRMFSVADQRSIPEIDVDDGDRGAVPGAAAHRRRPGRAPPRWPPSTRVHENSVPGSVPDMLAKLAEGIPVDGMEALLPLLRPTELALLSDHLPAGTPLLICDPEKVRTRAADLIKTGREFLEASWSTAAVGGDVPIDIEALGASGFRRARRRARRRPRRRAPVVDAEPAAATSRRSTSTSGRRRRRAASSATSTRSSRCCARTSRPAATPSSSPRAPAPRTASSSSWPNPTLPQRCWSRARHPKAGRRRRAQGPAARRRGDRRGQPRRHHRDRPDRQPGHRAPKASGWPPSAATSSTRWR